jgi:hypothetical protein
VRPDRGPIGEFEPHDAVVHRDSPNILPELDGSTPLLESGRKGPWDSVHAVDRHSRLCAGVVATEEVLDGIPRVVRIES